MKKIIALIFLICLYINAFAANFTTRVTVTTYNPTAAQCGKNCMLTANGTKINMRLLKNGSQKIVAISRDLLWCIPMDSIIEIEGYGKYIVADVMSPRMKHYIDILQHPSMENFKKEQVKITVIKKGTIN